jgi:disulfide oxidoreductase YuzD
MHPIQLKYKAIIRKKIASLRTNNSKTASRSITLEKLKLKAVTTAKDMLASIHLAEHTGDVAKCVSCIKLAQSQPATFGKLLATLERLVTEEESQYQYSKPSQTDIKRWALKAAVLDYYKGLSVDPSFIAIDNVMQNKTVHQLAPNKEAIYTIYMRKLADLTKKHDANRVNLNEFDEAE